VLVIDALPVTAVGKVFKPALRDLAIEEKVRLEVEHICGPDVSVATEVLVDAQKRTFASIRLGGATPAQRDAVEAALKPLPQRFSVEEQAGP
jgi:fatty-acyl-CoA synthase